MTSRPLTVTGVAGPPAVGAMSSDMAVAVVEEAPVAINTASRAPSRENAAADVH